MASVRGPAKSIALGFVLAWMAACGPTAGDPCRGDVFTCADPRTALECQANTWAEIPCRGPGGCRSSAGTILCDLSLNQAGDGCPWALEGQALCEAPGNTAVLECHDGVLSRTRSCSTCRVEDSLVSCTP